MSPARAAVLSVSAGQREVLEHVASSEATRPGDALRARALLLSADGVANETLARDLRVSPTTTRSWRRAFDGEGLASLAPSPGERGRRGTIPGLTLARAGDALTHNEHAAVRASDRQLALETGVSTATLQRLRADLRIGSGDAPPPRHHLVEVVGVLVAPPVAAIAVALDPVTHRRFMRSRRGPHMRGSCPGALVAAMGAADVLRARAPHPTAGAGAGAASPSWEDFMTEVAAQWPTGSHLHVVATGPDEAAPLASRHDGASDGLETAGAGLLRLRRTPSAAWRHGRLTMIARVLRAAGERGNLAGLPELLRALDTALAVAPPKGRRGAPTPFTWVADRAVAETTARRSRAEFIERTRIF